MPFELCVIACLSETGAWDEAPLLAMVDKKIFSVLVIKDLTDTTLYSPNLAHRIRENYAAAERCGDLTAYRPITRYQR